MSIDPQILETLEPLIDQLPEVYQSIYLGKELVREGLRQNDWERLEVIKDYIKPGQTILDVGSNVGFFTINLAKMFPDNVFVSVEKQYSYARLQAELIKLEGVKNVILINSVVTSDWLIKASQSCTYFDVTLLLSVLHHIEDAEYFLAELNKISKSFIIELPHPDESRVCGKDILKTQLTLDKISQVKPVFIKMDYEATTHCDTELTRSFYYADSPDYQREALFPYIGYPLNPRNYIIKSTDQGVVIHKSHLKQDIQIIPGVLLYDIAQIGQIFAPQYETVKQQIESQFKRLNTLDNVADIRPWNLLFTAEGLKFIDYQYTSDLDVDLKFDHQKDFNLICNFINDLFGVYPKPQILIDGVFFQLYQTGIARVWKSLLEEWSTQDFSKHILVLDRAGTAPRIRGIRYRTIPAYSYSNTDQDKQMLQYICDEEEADLFISTYYTTPLITPSVFMAYDMIPEVLGGNLNEPMWREKHQAIRHASAYISISENTAKDLVKLFPNLSLDAVTVAHCGVSSIYTQATVEEIRQFRIKYGIYKPYFILVGMSNGYKNGELFFKAFSQLSTAHGFELVCTGTGAFFMSEFRQYTPGVVVHPLQLNDEELKAAYSGAVALVYPSIYEGFGLPILEALACGCPVITCSNASIPEVAGEAALYVNDHDVNGLTDALCEVQKLKVREFLIEAGLEQAKKFSWSKMADQVSSALINATLLPLNLREINLVVFPDWSQPEETLYLELGTIIQAISNHPDRSQITLLIDNSNIIDEDADLALSSVIMNLMMEAEFEVDESVEMTLIGNLSQMQWKALLTHVQGWVRLEHENQEAIAFFGAEIIPVYDLENNNT